MIRLTPDKPRYRWGDPIIVEYDGDAGDLVTSVEPHGTARVGDAELPLRGELLFGPSYAPPKLEGYEFAPYDAPNRWVGDVVEGARPPGREAWITGAVTTLRSITTVSARVELASAMPVGWAPGQRAGESAVAAVQRMLADYPVPGAVRIFVGAGDGLPSWTSGVLAEIPDDVDLIVVSIKDWRVPVAAWLDQMPEKFRGRIVLCLDHEPEQQEGGDPTPAEFRAEWAELVAALRDHPRRSWLLLALVFTRFYWARNPDAFADFMPADVLDGIDVIGWDVYDPATSGPYETAESMLTVPLAIKARTGKPVMLCEVGIRRKGWDTTGEACADAMQAWHDAAANAGCLGWMWFHKGDHDLVLKDRDAEREKLADLILAA